MKRPFIITIASEKGGVGKTTIATNLAVYLKALREDLPVTIASFDNHFSVDQMFALGPRPHHDISGLLGDVPFAQLVALGQYGVQYIASSRNLQQPSHEPVWLRNRLASVEAPGVMILDTRPILDWFSEAALLAADLVLVPIKDRAALLNAESLRQVLKQEACADRLCLLPSLVDTRARLNTEVRVHEFLRYAARERDYQILDIQISKSPKVESLASGFSSRIRPVITHARNTAVHGQFRQLAEFALQKFDATVTTPALPRLSPSHHKDDVLSVTQRRKVPECPVCCQPFASNKGHFFFDMRSRRCGHVHTGCYAIILAALNIEETDCADGGLAIVLEGPGLVELNSRIAVYLCTHDGHLVESENLALDDLAKLRQMLEMMTGLSLDEAYRETILLNSTQNVFAQAEPDANFKQKRRKIMRSIHNAGLI
jgi:cellulose biosynthesis protein BcsQ